MDNFLQKMSGKTLFVYTICLLSSLIPITEGADPNFLSIDCPNISTPTYAQNSTYQTNLNTLLSILSSNSNNASNGFYNFTAGTTPPDIAYGLFLCRGDLSAAACRDCVVFATTDVVKRCPGSKRVNLWYVECLLRYSNVSIFATADTRLWIVLTNPTDVTNGTRFTEVLGGVMLDIADRASSDNSGKKFAVGEAYYSPLQTVYGQAQCTPDLSNFKCYGCIRNGVSKFPEAKLGGRVLFPSCYVRYETYPFYNANFGAAPPPPLPVLPPPSTTTPCSPGSGGTSSQVIMAIVVPIIGVAVMLFIAGSYFLTRRAEKKYNYSLKDDKVELIASMEPESLVATGISNNLLQIEGSSSLLSKILDNSES